MKVKKIQSFDHLNLIFMIWCCEFINFQSWGNWVCFGSFKRQDVWNICKSQWINNSSRLEIYLSSMLNFSSYDRCNIEFSKRWMRSGNDGEMIVTMIADFTNKLGIIRCLDYYRKSLDISLRPIIYSFLSSKNSFFLTSIEI